MSSSGATHVPGQPSTVPSPRTVLCRDSGLPHNTRNNMGTSGNVFERLPAQEGQHSTLFNMSKNLASSSQKKKQGPDTEGSTRSRTVKCDKNCNIRRLLFSASEVEWTVESYWWNFFSQ